MRNEWSGEGQGVRLWARDGDGVAARFVAIGGDDEAFDRNLIADDIQARCGGKIERVDIRYVAEYCRVARDIRAARRVAILIFGEGGGSGFGDIEFGFAGRRVPCAVENDGVGGAAGEGRVARDGLQERRGGGKASRHDAAVLLEALLDGQQENISLVAGDAGVLDGDVGGSESGAEGSEFRVEVRQSIAAGQEERGGEPCGRGGVDLRPQTRNIVEGFEIVAFAGTQSGDAGNGVDIDGTRHCACDHRLELLVAHSYRELFEVFVGDGVGAGIVGGFDGNNRGFEGGTVCLEVGEGIAALKQERIGCAEFRVDLRPMIDELSHGRQVRTECADGHFALLLGIETGQGINTAVIYRVNYGHGWLDDVLGR